MKTNVFSEELLPACSVNSRTDLHSGSVFILSINDVMFITAAIIREGRRFISMHRKKKRSLLHPSRAVSLHLVPVPCVIEGCFCSILPELCHFTWYLFHVWFPWKNVSEQLPRVCQGRACCCAFLELTQWPPSCGDMPHVWCWGHSWRSFLRS